MTHERESRMRSSTEKQVRQLLETLEALDARSRCPEERAIVAAEREAIVEELSRLVRADGLAVYRRGDSIEAVSMVG